LRASSDGTDAHVFQCIRAGIAVYSPHTALDAATGGTNDVIAGLCGIKQAEPLEYVEASTTEECKIVVFVPPDHVESVAAAMFAAGAGHIGEYSHCSYRSAGEGTFLGGESTHPTIGRRERLEHVTETRLECVLRSADLPAVVKALRTSHPYEEPAFDIYRLQGRPVLGIGRWGRLPRAVTSGTLARELKRATAARCVQIVGPVNRRVERAVVVVGAAGTLPFRMPLSAADVVVTGEIRHHDALSFQRAGCTVIALGHWASERPVLTPLASRLKTLLPGATILVSKRDCDPFVAV
jgi:hypothetical protein